MKKSINQWSFGGLNIYEAMQLAARAGYEAFEPAFDEKGAVSPKTGPTDSKALLKEAEKAGVEIASVASGFFWQYNLTSDDPAMREKAEELTAIALERAGWLEAGSLLVIPGIVAPGFGITREVVPYDVCYDRALDALKRLAPVAEKHQVTIAVENVWNGFLLSPLEMRDFVDAVGSEYVGVYFDVGNVIVTGFPEHWIRILGPRISRIHMKDFRRSVGTINGFVDLLAGDVNWPEVMKALREVGYDGPLTAEMGRYAADLEGIIWQTSAALDRIMKMG